MIQFNLLPDIKLEYIKTRRAKRLVMLMAGVVSAVSLTLLLLLFMVVHVFQQQHMANLTEDIKHDKQIIENTPDIEDILTIQNQLTSLDDLHEKKPVTTRLFEYIKQVTPANVSIARLEVKFAETENTINITGAADSISTINKFVDTLKFTKYQAGETNEEAFNQVVLSSYGLDVRGASYTINLKFKPAIFASANDVKLTIPNIITTRSALEKPGVLFQPLNNPDLDEAGDQ